jgi:hypothetical protein
VLEAVTNVALVREKITMNGRFLSMILVSTC